MAEAMSLLEFKSRVTCIFATPPTHCQEESNLSTQIDSIQKLIGDFLDGITCQMIKGSLKRDRVQGLIEAVIDLIATAACEQWIKMSTFVYDSCRGRVTKSFMIEVLKSGSLRQKRGQTKLIEAQLQSPKVHVLTVYKCEKCHLKFKRFSSKICLSLDLNNASLPEFVMAVLHSLKPVNLERSKSKDGEILEYVWQDEFYRAATAILPVDMHISPEYNDLANKNEGRIDFTVETWRPDKKIKWCIELVRNGVKLEEHVKKFEDGGIYKEIKCEDHIIVDFRHKSAKGKDPEKYEKVWFVNHSDDFTYMEVMKVGDIRMKSGNNKVDTFKVIKLPPEGHEQCSLREKINQKCKDYETETLRHEIETLRHEIETLK